METLTTTTSDAPTHASNGTPLGTNDGTANRRVLGTVRRVIAEMSDLDPGATLRETGWADDETPGTVRTCAVCETPKLGIRFNRFRSGNGRWRYYFACIRCRRMLSRIVTILDASGLPKRGVPALMRSVLSARPTPSVHEPTRHSNKNHWHHWEWPPTGDDWTSRALCTHMTKKSARKCVYHERFSILGGCSHTCAYDGVYNPPWEELPVGYRQYPNPPGVQRDNVASCGWEDLPDRQPQYADPA